MKQVKLVQMIGYPPKLVAHGEIVAFIGFNNTMGLGKISLTPGILKEIKQYEKEICGYRAPTLARFCLYLLNLVRR